MSTKTYPALRTARVESDRPAVSERYRPTEDGTLPCAACHQRFPDHLMRRAVADSARVAAGTAWLCEPCWNNRFWSAS